MRQHHELRARYVNMGSIRTFFYYIYYFLVFVIAVGEALMGAFFCKTMLADFYSVQTAGMPHNYMRSWSENKYVWNTQSGCDMR